VLRYVFVTVVVIAVSVLSYRCLYAALEEIAAFARSLLESQRFSFFQLGRNTPERALHAHLDILVADNQAALLIARNQHQFLVRACVQLRTISNQSLTLPNRGQTTTDLVQALQDMRHIQHRVPVFVDLMKNVVPEELDDVPIASFRPSRLAGESENTPRKPWYTREEWIPQTLAVR
jgi:hypothetical protein